MQNKQVPLTTAIVCGCHKTKCLKLYCECFAEGKYCLNCSCKSCHNTVDYEEERKEAHRDWLHSLPPSNAAIIREAHN